MSGPGSRKPLAQLVGTTCDSGIQVPQHSGFIAKVIGSCEHGHGTIGNYEDSIWVKDFTPVDTCDACWQEMTKVIQEGSRLVPCGDCGHGCLLEITAEWPNGNTITLRYTPQAGNHKEKEAS